MMNTVFQKRLFEESWKELFIINLAHWMLTVNLGTATVEGTTPNPFAHLHQTVKLFQMSTTNTVSVSNSVTTPDSSSSSTDIMQPRLVEHSDDRDINDDVTPKSSDVNVDDDKDADDDDDDVGSESELKNKGAKKSAVVEKESNIYMRLCENMQEDMKEIETVVKWFRMLAPDGTECACLKAIALFKPGITKFV